MTIETELKNELRYHASKKSVFIAYLLWFFLGTIGAHRFYVGKIPSGIIMLVLCVISWVLTLVFVGVIGFGILFVWLLVDVFLVHVYVSQHNTRLMDSL